MTWMHENTYPGLLMCTSAHFYHDHLHFCEFLLPDNQVSFTQIQHFSSIHRMVINPAFLEIRASVISIIKDANGNRLVFILVIQFIIIIIRYADVLRYNHNYQVPGFECKMHYFLACPGQCFSITKSAVSYQPAENRKHKFLL